MKKNSVLFLSLILFIAIFLGASSVSQAQNSIKWMSVGSLHNWYSDMGCEIEEGFIKEQQYGMRWPALYDYMDIQAWKGLWIGTKNFKDAAGKTWGTKVVHVGPRVSGANEFFPVSFKMKSKFNRPMVYVDGAVSEREATGVTIDTIDPNLPWDREIETVCNTALGITMTRKIYQFSHPFHDNYIVNEIILKNTGKADPTDLNKVTLPGQKVDSLMLFCQYRLAVSRQADYVIGNATRWGKNTCYDARHDGKATGVTNPANWETSVPGENDLRCQFAWHGKFNDFKDYDNIGGPIWKYAAYAGLDAGDTIGRLGATQFAGILTLHVDKSGTDTTDDVSQPSTTTTFFSDDILQRANDASNEGKCTQEYLLMRAGHSERHLKQIGETNLILPTKDVFRGDNGGLSMGDGYGPFTLNFGESIRIVYVEAVAGMSRDKNVEYGKKYKSDRDATFKNTEVMKGKDSLMYTFKRALDNYNSNWTKAKTLLPPKEFNVTGLGKKITLSWSLYNEADPDVKRFRIYRTLGKRDSNFVLIANLPASARSFDDTSAQRGISAYYYIQAVGNPITADANLKIWGDSIVSNSNYTATADPATLKRPPGDLIKMRVVPNPYNKAAATNLLFGERKDRINFFEIPGNCTIKIYTEYGELIKTIHHTNGTGDEPWDCNTESNQLVVSGIYIAVVKDNDTGKSGTCKFVVIR